MPRRLTSMTWDDVQNEMSIAGSPEKVRKMGEDIEAIINKGIVMNNRAELTNIEFMLKRHLAEIKLYQKMYDQRH